MGQEDLLGEVRASPDAKNKWEWTEQTSVVQAGDDVARKEQKPTSQRSKKTGHIQWSRHDMVGATEDVPLNFL